MPQAKRTAAKSSPSPSSSQGATHDKVVKGKQDILNDIQFGEREVWRFELIGSAPVIQLLGNNNIKAYNPKSNRHENIRYCEGEDTIWVSEQPKEVEKTPISFDNGFLEVHPTEETLLEFLFRHPDYDKKFRLIDRERDAKEKKESIVVLMEATQKALSADFASLQVVARALGLDYETEELCRMACYEYANNSPKKFLESFDNELMQVISTIKEAMDSSVLTVDGDSIKWGDSGKVVQVCPTGVEPTNYFAQVLVNPTDKNVAMLSEIRKRLKSE